MRKRSLKQNLHVTRYTEHNTEINIKGNISMCKIRCNLYNRYTVLNKHNISMCKIRCNLYNRYTVLNKHNIHNPKCIKQNWNIGQAYYLNIPLRKDPLNLCKIYIKITFPLKRQISISLSAL